MTILLGVLSLSPALHAQDWNQVARSVTIYRDTWGVPHVSVNLQCFRRPLDFKQALHSEQLREKRRCSSLLTANNRRPQMQIRGRYMGARLLDALGFRQQAEGLFNEVVGERLPQTGQRLPREGERLPQTGRTLMKTEQALS